MATIQDLKALELNIYEAVEEYLASPDAYDHPVLHVYLDKYQMKHRAEIIENMMGSEDDGIYPIVSLVNNGFDCREPDIDRVSDIANSWIFLE